MTSFVTMGEGREHIPYSYVLCPKIYPRPVGVCGLIYSCHLERVFLPVSVVWEIMIGCHINFPKQKEESIGGQYWGMAWASGGLRNLGESFPGTAERTQRR
jgi:hypothetical protein